MMSLINPEHDKISKKPLKRSMTGLEVEYFLIDNKGKISHKAPGIISSLLEHDPHIMPEIGKNMVEFGCYPNVDTYYPSLNMMDSLERAINFCQKKELQFYPFATYPGSFVPKLNTSKKYKTHIKIYGIEKKNIAARVAGFHHHYSLPKGVFDKEKKMLRILRKGKLGRSLMSSYNFEIASDPVLTLFAQSSPFYQGKFIAKDSRALAYRGGKKLGYEHGLYSNHQQLGGLPPYKQTATDLMVSLEKRWQRFEAEAHKVDPKIDLNKLYPYKLDITWNPVKINKHGTLEQRGMDVNLPSVMIAIAVLLKFCLKKIQREFLEILPADHGVDEAFKVEGGVLYVPPHTVIRDTLQSLSVYHGYKSDLMHNYTKRFFSFAQSCTPKSYNKIISPVKEMIENRTSISDKILTYAKRKGFVNKTGGISNKNAAQLALHYSAMLPRDLAETKKNLEKMSSV
jgi:hypothetical protein